MAKVIKRMVDRLVKTKLPTVVQAERVFDVKTPVTDTHYVTILNSFTLCTGYIHMFLMIRERNVESITYEHYYLIIDPIKIETHVFKIDLTDDTSTEVLVDISTFGLTIENNSVYFNVHSGYDLVCPQVGDELVNGYRIINIDEETGSIIITNRDNVYLEISKDIPMFDSLRYNLVCVDEEKTTLFADGELLRNKHNVLC